MRTMAACPTRTHGKFVLDYGSPTESSFVPILDSLLFEMFSLLRFSSSLSSLDIQVNRHSHLHVPLLPSDLSAETLILSPGAMELPYHAENIARFFSRNSGLKSCTLGLDSCDFRRCPQFLKIILSPFTTRVQSKANVVLKELVLRIESSNVPSGLWEDVAKLLCGNTSLQKLELLFSPECSLSTARKVCFNRALKEFGCRCSAAELSLLEDCVGTFVQAKSPLTSLKLFPASTLLGRDFMQSLGPHLRHYRYVSVKHVQVSSVTMGQPWTTWNASNDDARAVDLGTEETLKSMVSNEPRLNTTLQSLVVGNWKLFRVGR